MNFRLSMLALAAGAAAAVAAPTESTPPESRDAKRLFLAAKQEASMSPSEGKAPELRELLDEGAEGARPGLRDLLGNSGEPAAKLPGLGQVGGGWGGGGQNPPPAPDGDPTQRFLRFLENGMRQAYNKSYREGYNILNTHVRNALNTDTSQLPPALVFALRTGRNSTGGLTFESAWEILHTTVKTLVERPGPFMGSRQESFSATLALGRACSQEKSWEEGYKAIAGFVKALVDNPEYCPDQLHHRTLKLNYKAAGGQIYEHAWKILANGTARIRQGVPNMGHLYAVALAADDHMSFEAGYKVLNTFMDGAREMRDQFPNELTYVAAVRLDKAMGGQVYKAAWQIAQAGCEGLQNSIQSPGQYFGLGLQASKEKTFEAGYKVLRSFADGVAGSGAFDEFTKMSIRSAIQASGGKYYKDAYNILRDAFRQQM